MAVVTVPKTAVREEHSMIAREHKVGLAWQCPLMEPEPKSCHVKSTAKDEFRLGVFPPDSGHHPASDIGRNDIRHPTPLQASGQAA
jgi:hypothetical protein